MPLLPHRLLGQGRILHVRHQKLFKVRELAVKIPARLRLHLRRQDRSHDTAMNIIITNIARFQDLVRINELRRLTGVQTEHLRDAELITDIIEHDPSCRREKEFYFGKLAVGPRV